MVGYDENAIDILKNAILYDGLLMVNTEFEELPRVVIGFKLVQAPILDISLIGNSIDSIIPIQNL